MMRKTIEDFTKYFSNTQLFTLMKQIQEDFREDVYNLSLLYGKFSSFAKENMTEKEYLAILIKAAVELTSKRSAEVGVYSGKIFGFSYL